MLHALGQAEVAGRLQLGGAGVQAVPNLQSASTSLMFSRWRPCITLSSCTEVWRERQGGGLRAQLKHVRA